MVYSDPAVTQSETLPQVLLARAVSTPDALAERHKRLGIWREFTWSDVLGKVRDLALGLEAKGLKAGDSIMMIGENEPEHFWAEYAVQSLGGKVLSVYPDQTADEILYLAEDSRTRVFLAQDQEQVDKCIEIAEQYQGAIAIVYWDGSGLWGYDHPLLHSFDSLSEAGHQIHAKDPSRFEEHIKRGRAEDTALLSYTSGTTGKPKGVVISHRYLFDNSSRVMGAINIAPGTEYLTYISPAWVTEQIFGLSIGCSGQWSSTFPKALKMCSPIFANWRLTRWCSARASGKIWRPLFRPGCWVRASSATRCIIGR